MHLIGSVIAGILEQAQLLKKQDGQSILIARGRELEGRWRAKVSDGSGVSRRSRSTRASPVKGFCHETGRIIIFRGSCSNIGQANLNRRFSVRLNSRSKSPTPQQRNRIHRCAIHPEGSPSPSCRLPANCSASASDRVR